MPGLAGATQKFRIITLFPNQRGALHVNNNEEEYLDQRRQINGTENVKNILGIDQTGNTPNIEFKSRFQNLKFDSKQFATF